MTTSTTARPPYVSAGLVPGVTAGSGAADSWNLVLLGPYFGLRHTDACSLHAEAVLQTYSELDPASPRSPAQLHTPRGLRRLAAVQLGTPELAAADPRRLPRELQTDRWRRLVELYDHTADLSAEQRLRLAALLSALGFDDHAVAVLPDVGVPHDGSDPLDVKIAMKRSHAAKRASEDDASRGHDTRVLEAVATCVPAGRRTNITAALTLVVLHSRGRTPDVAAAAHWREVATGHLARLRGEEPLDLLAESTYWRAVSYLPFLRGDHDGTRQELDRAEALARALPDSDAVQRRLRTHNLHPLLETRCRAAQAAGDLDAAIGYGVELTRLDPYDGKVFLSFGDLMLKSGDRAAATAAYRRAALLGAPHAPRAHFALGRLHEAAGDPDAALNSYMRVAHLDPLAYSAVQCIHRLASSGRRPDLTSWSTAWLDAARRRLPARDRGEEPAS